MTIEARLPFVRRYRTRMNVGNAVELGQSGQTTATGHNLSDLSIEPAGGQALQGNPDRHRKMSYAGPWTPDRRG